MDNQYKTPFLDYYCRHNISPVSQDISTLEKHFERRNALYRHCGIPSSFIEGKSVLEVGPGTGHNAIFTNAMKPQKYVLVDGNPKSIQETSRLLKSYFGDISNCEIIKCNFNHFTSDVQFDIVLCEGTIPGQKDPIRFLSKLSKFVKPSGVLLITCVDHVSVLAETLRKVVARLMIGREMLNENEKLEKLRPFFLRSLRTIKGMSRPVDDWIYDNVLQPIIGRLLSIEDAIRCLESDFDAYAVSPHFSIDWRWYKDIYGSQQQYNRLLIDCYRKNIHNLLDYRYVFDSIEPEIIINLESLSKSIFDISIRMQNGEIDKCIVSELKCFLNDLSILTRKFSGGTTESIQQFADAIDEFLLDEPFPCELVRFEPWFGRGQQHMSFIRKDSLTHLRPPIAKGKNSP
ncbi:class I SAM-dependent methyltransferase [Thermodesulfobacteriota bacterium]